MPTLRVATAVVSIALLTTGCPLIEDPEPVPLTEDAGGGDDIDDNDNDPLPSAPAAIEFPDDEFVIERDSPTQPEAEVYDGNGELLENYPVDWSSDNPEIVEISSGGMAIGHEIGETELVAVAGEVTNSWPTRVVGAAVADVTVIPEDTDIVIGQQIPYAVNLRDAANTPIDDERPVDWTSADPDIATIDDDGMVEGVGPGDTEIIAVVEGVEGRGELTVEDVDIVDVEINASDAETIIAGDTAQLEATGYTAGDQSIDGIAGDWSSNDESVVTIDDQGGLEAVDVGEATIEFQFDDLSDELDVEVIFPVAHIDTGDGFVCAIAGDDSLYCAGDNDQGQLADSTTDDSTIAVASSFGSSVEELSLGQNHGCLIDDNADIYCWGDNDSGQVDGSPGGSISDPVEVTISGDAVDISAGQLHSCAVTDSDDVYCWGANDDYQLGVSDTSEAGPVSVSGSTGFTAVAAGTQHTCAAGTDESGYCWGANDRGQLGGSTDDDDSSTPELVDGGYEFAALSAGNDFTCGTHPSGPPACWGANDRGQLGSSGTTDQDVPLTLALDSGESMLRLNAGDEHVCGVVTGALARCWGAHDDDRLGIDTSDDITSPEEVDDDRQFDVVAAGSDHSCGLTPDNAVYCWGNSPGDGLGFEPLNFDW